MNDDRMIAIVGSRDYPLLSLVREFVWELREGSTVISGGAKGVDTTAAVAARNRGLSVVEFCIVPPDREDFPGDLWGAEFRRLAHARNQRIVDACERLVAFWDEDSGGTLDTVRRARLKKVPIQIIGKRGYELAGSSHAALARLWAHTAEPGAHTHE